MTCVPCVFAVSNLLDTTYSQSPYIRCHFPYINRIPLIPYIGLRDMKTQSGHWQMHLHVQQVPFGKAFLSFIDLFRLSLSLCLKGASTLETWFQIKLSQCVTSLSQKLSIFQDSILYFNLQLSRKMFLLTLLLALQSFTPNSYTWILETTPFKLWDACEVVKFKTLHAVEGRWKQP